MFSSKSPNPKVRTVCYGNRNEADFTIHLKGLDIFCHRSKLEDVSPPFRELLKSGSSVKIEDTPEAFEVMMKWIYTGSYFDENKPHQNLNWQVHLAVMEIADQWEVVDLATQALNKFRKLMMEELDEREALDVIDSLIHDEDLPMRVQRVLEDANRERLEYVRGPQFGKIAFERDLDSEETMDLVSVHLLICGNCARTTFLRKPDTHKCCGQEMGNIHCWVREKDARILFG